MRTTLARNRVCAKLTVSSEVAHRTAKVWKDFKLAYTLEGHEQSVWAVLALEGDEDLVLTGKQHARRIAHFEERIDS